MEELGTKETWLRNSRKRDVNTSTTVSAQLNQMKIKAKRRGKCKSDENCERSGTPLRNYAYIKKNQRQTYSLEKKRSRKNIQDQIT